MTSDLAILKIVLLKNVICYSLRGDIIQNVLKMHVLLDSQEMTSAKLNKHFDYTWLHTLKRISVTQISVCIEFKVGSQWPYKF